MAKKFYSTIPEFVIKPRNPLFQDLEGLKFERILIIGHAGKINKQRFWFVECDCGNIFKASASHVKRGDIKSCGCLRREIPFKHGHAANGVLTPTYQTWRRIFTRCYNKKTKDYKDYGGRGITVCDSWRESFENFLSDMGEKPKGKTLGRIENNKGYFKENCRWATPIEQANNKRNNRFIAYCGKTKTLSQWAHEFNMKPNKLWQRLKRGWDINKALLAE